ncbi:hypothetical protein GCM10008023_25340 [Sphingomonas glacialis]|uniref:Uncharacterized protein n=1 Tax=Sphingomonas glacialis TaxID=658225 RepID=A0ABQ3LUX4_9SPHN|nr:hypothetical protein GCM10008023_25340 [Sphingomonas glacialis]
MANHRQAGPPPKRVKRIAAAEAAKTSKPITTARMADRKENVTRNSANICQAYALWTQEDTGNRG